MWSSIWTVSGTVSCEFSHFPLFFTSQFFLSWNIPYSLQTFRISIPFICPCFGEWQIERWSHNCSFIGIYEESLLLIPSCSVNVTVLIILSRLIPVIHIKSVCYFKITFGAACARKNSISLYLLIQCWIIHSTAE